MIMICVFLLYIFCSLSEIFSHKTSSLQKNYNNNELRGIDNKNKYPYVVAIGRRGKSYLRLCTGSMITSEWVITAAHCFYRRPNDMQIEYGDLTLPEYSSDAKFRNVLDIIRHNKFMLATKRIKNDIAMLLTEKVELNFYGKLSAVDFISMIGLPVRYVGVISISENIIETSRRDQTGVRQYGEAVINRCHTLNPGVSGYPSICLASTDVPYFGDSGGPLLHAGKIIGVCSGGFRFDGLQRETRFTPISAYLDWITRILNAERNTYPYV